MKYLVIDGFKKPKMDSINTFVKMFLQRLKRPVIIPHSISL